MGAVILMPSLSQPLCATQQRADRAAGLPTTRWDLRTEVRESVQRGLPDCLPQHLSGLCPRFGEVTNTVSPGSVGSSAPSGCSEGEVLNHILYWAVAVCGPRGLGAEPWGLPAGSIALR